MNKPQNSKAMTTKKLREAVQEIINAYDRERDHHISSKKRPGFIHSFTNFGQTWKKFVKDSEGAAMALSLAKTLDQFISTESPEVVNRTTYTLPYGLLARDPWERLGQVMSAFTENPTVPTTLGVLSFQWQLQDCRRRGKTERQGSIRTQNGIAPPTASTQEPSVLGVRDIWPMVWGSDNDLRKEMVHLIHERRTFELPFVSLDPQYANLPARSQVAILKRSLHDARKQAPRADIDSPTLPGATKQVLHPGEDNTANASRIRRQGRR